MGSAEDQEARFPHGTNGTAPAAEGHISDYLGILRARLKTVLLVPVLVACGTLVSTFLMTPIYEASVTLQIGDEADRMPLLREFEVLPQERLSRSPDPILSEVEIVKSRTIAADVVRQLHLNVRVEGLPSSTSVAIHPLSPVDQVRPGTYTVVFTDARGEFELKDGAGQRVVLGRIGEPFDLAGCSFRIQGEAARSGMRWTLRLVEFREEVAALQERMKVAEVARTNIIRVTVKDTSPELAAATANAVAQAYITSTVKRRSQQALSTREFIAQQLTALQEELETSGRALSDYKSDKGIVTLSKEADRLLEKATEEEVALAKLVAQTEEARALLAVLHKPRESSSIPLVVSTAGIPSPVLAELARRLTELELGRAALRETYTENNPTMRILEAQIGEARRKLAEELEATIQALEERQKAVAQVLRQYEEELRKLPAAELGLAGLLRTEKVNEELYTFMLKKLEESRIAEESEIGSARVVDAAITPKFPSHPQKRKYFMMSLFVGLVLGVGLAFLQHYLDRSIRSVGEMEKGVGLSTFGVIPELEDGARRSAAKPGNEGTRRRGAGSTKTRRRKAKPAPQMSGKLVVGDFGSSPASESYKTLRTNIQFAAPDLSSRCFLLTSAGPGEGKSLTCSNLGIVLAQLGKRTLLIDADLRWPTLHQLLALSREPGLTETLVGNTAFKESLRETQVESLYLLPAGRVPPNPAELLSSRPMEQLVAEARRDFDTVLIDSPPALPFTDGALLGALVDGIFLVVKAGVTTPEAVVRTKRVLEGAKGRVLGAILNDVTFPGGYGLSGTYSRYYSYHYRYRSRNDENGAGRLRALKGLAGRVIGTWKDRLLRVGRKGKNERRNDPRPKR